MHLPFELILRRRGQVELNRDILKEDLGDVKGDWDEAGCLGIQIQGDVSILNDGANGVGVSDEGHRGLSALYLRDVDLVQLDVNTGKVDVQT